MLNMFYTDCYLRYMINKTKTVLKQFLYFVFNYQPKIDWNKRIKLHGNASVFNNETEELNRLKVTSEQNSIYFELIKNLNDHENLFSSDSRILDFGCGYGRHFNLLKDSTKSNKIYGYDPYSDLFEINRNYFNVYNSHKDFNLEEKFNLIFIHLVVGGLNDKDLVHELNFIYSILNNNGYIFIVEACSPSKEQLYTSWKIRNPETYFNILKNINWEIKDIISESGDELYIMIGRKSLKDENS